MTNQRKYHLFLGCIPFLCLFAYQIAIKPTLKEYHGFKNWRLICENSENYPKQVNYLTEKILLLDRKLGINEEGVPLSSIDVLSTVISLCDTNAVQLSEMPSPKRIVDDKISIFVYEFEFSGEYKNIIRFLFAIEKKKGFAKLLSADFYIDNKNIEEVQLLCRVFMQTFIINHDNNELQNQNNITYL